MRSQLLPVVLIHTPDLSIDQLSVQLEVIEVNLGTAINVLGHIQVLFQWL